MKKNIQDLKEQAPEVELPQEEDQKIKGGFVIIDDLIGF